MMIKQEEIFLKLIIQSPKKQTEDNLEEKDPEDKKKRNLLLMKTLFVPIQLIFLRI